MGLLVTGCILGVFAVVLLAGGGWALWKDRMDRDADGFVSIGTTDLRTETYALVGDLRGAGPSWLWGSTVMGDERVRATSLSDRPDCRKDWTRATYVLSARKSSHQAFRGLNSTLA